MRDSGGSAITYDEYLAKEHRPRTLDKINITENYSSLSETSETIYVFTGDEAEDLYVVANTRDKAIRAAKQYYMETIGYEPDEYTCCKADVYTRQRYNRDVLEPLIVA